MNQTKRQPSEQNPVAPVRSAPGWAERAIGVAAAAVFAAGIISAGLVDSDGGAGGPALAAPANATSPSGGGAVRSVDHVVLPPASSPTGVQRTSTARTNTNTARGGTSAVLDRGAGLVPSRPSSPQLGSTPPPSGSPGQPPVDSTATATPSVGVAVGPIAVGASPDGAGASVGTTTVGDQTSVPDQSGGVTVDADSGVDVLEPIALALP